MTYKRLPLSWKLFAAVSLVSVLIIAFLVLSVAYSLRHSVSWFLEEELKGFDRLEARLAALHEPADPGWPEFRGDRLRWGRFAAAQLDSPPWITGAWTASARQLPPDADNERVDRTYPISTPLLDPLDYAARLPLLGAGGDIIVGGIEGVAIAAKRPIMLANEDGSETVLGWLALTADPSRVATLEGLIWRIQFSVLLSSSFLALCLSALAAYVLSRQFLRPVDDLVRGNRKLAAGDLSVRMDNNRADELGVLIDQFNLLAETLEREDKGERQRLSDTAHEIKTPLSVLRAQVEAVQDGIHAPDKKAIENIHDSIMRLTRLVDDLNLVSNSREVGLAVDKQPQDIGAVISGVVEGFASQALKKGLIVRLDLADDLVIECDRLRICQLVENLLQNSCGYTSAPGTIVVSAKRLAGSIEIVVDDSAPAPAEELLPRLFDRFYRAENSRARQFGGSGLGLAVCREIVHAHGGSITASHSPLGGLRVNVLLPVGN